MTCVSFFCSKIDEKPLYLYANKVAPKKKEELAQNGMLVEDSDLTFTEASDKETQLQTLKKIVGSSIIHKSVQFKHTSIEIDNANIGRNV